ncbi:MAG: hypothetical protein WKG07_22425 [Hymenobacter sp.]
MTQVSLARVGGQPYYRLVSKGADGKPTVQYRSTRDGQLLPDGEMRYAAELGQEFMRALNGRPRHRQRHRRGRRRGPARLLRRAHPGSRSPGRHRRARRGGGRRPRAGPGQPAQPRTGDQVCRRIRLREQAPAGDEASLRRPRPPGPVRGARHRPPGRPRHRWRPARGLVVRGAPQVFPHGLGRQEYPRLRWPCSRRWACWPSRSTASRCC